MTTDERLQERIVRAALWLVMYSNKPVDFQLYLAELLKAARELQAYRA